MNVGFDTIGSATVICYDRVPVLITDPWVVGSAFFGSWTLTHEIPREQMEAINSSSHVWFSHGHPDHLNPESLVLFRDKKILLPDHVGKRIYNELIQDGYNVQILRDRVWYHLSNNIRVLCIADYNQDAILLIDINGRLLVNLNDASDHGWGRFVKKLISQYDISFLLALECTEDIDMFNFYDESGTPIRPENARENSLGRRAALRLANFGARHFIPFSSMHRYQREDSVWANQYGAPLSDYHRGPESVIGKILPAFIRYDCINDSLAEINPSENELTILAPSVFGDDWSELLEKDEAADVEQYLRSIEHLGGFLDFINVRVGGKDNVVEFAKRKFNRGLTFEVPRQSLVTAVSYKVFDDLLIGNFMKATLTGKWRHKRLYPDFTPYVAKYADNGGARTDAELEKYFREYRERSPSDYLKTHVIRFLHQNLEYRAIDTFRSFVPTDSKTYRVTKKVYRTFKKPTTF